ILNAVTEKTYAKVTNIADNTTREVLIEPIANYNVLVLDQRFNTNSSVSLVNTNVMRDGNFRDANVSALVYDLNTKANTYNLSGDFKYSYVNEHGSLDDRDGISAFVSLGETSGKIRYNFGANYTSKEFDSNDLGLLYVANFHGLFFTASYRILNPNKTFNNFQVNANPYLEFNNDSGLLQQADFNANVFGNTRKNDYYDISLTTRDR